MIKLPLSATRKTERWPDAIRPMLARLSQTLPEPDYAFGYEFKWDGIRGVVFWDGRRLRIQSRSLRDITHEYPELQGLSAQLGRRRAILDGEIVALGDDGSPSFERLQQRLGVAPGLVAGRAAEIGVSYLIFDILYLNATNLMEQPYVQRREILDTLKLSGEHWNVPGWWEGGGHEVLETSRKFRLEGVVAKRLDSVYECGKRSGAWIKLKNIQRAEFVIGGWMPGEGRRENTIGSLLLGYYDPGRAEAQRRGVRQRLLYAGKAGTGFTDAMLDRLKAMLLPRAIPTSPFEPSREIPRIARFARPEFVGKFEFAEWTQQKIVRHPSFKGLRIDKDPFDVVLEQSGKV